MIRKLTAPDETGQQAYYFVLIEPKDFPRYEAMLKNPPENGMVDIRDYGKIIAACYGSEPDTETKAFLKEKYGFEV